MHGVPAARTAEDGPEARRIEVRGLSKAFGANSAEALELARAGASKAEILERTGSVLAVNDVSFSVDAGEIFVVMGLSGSGKSTLVRCLSRLIEVTSGRIEIDGQDIGALGPRDLMALRREKMGMVFQSFGLLPHRTVLDNVAFPLEMRGQERHARIARARAMLDLVGLSERADYYPRELSGGQQQRVGIARSLAIEPAVWFLDEPFSALDPLIRKQLQGTFMALSAELHKTTVFITHDLDEAIRIGDRIAIMKDGALVQIGTPEQIVTEPADDYVAEFVAGISKLDLVTAGRIMQPVAQFGADDMTEWPRARAGDKLNALVDLAVGTDHPIVIVEDGAPVGIVTKRALLRGIQGREEAA